MAIRRSSSLGLSGNELLNPASRAWFANVGQMEGQMQRRQLIVVAPPLGPLVGGLLAAAIGA